MQVKPMTVEGLLKKVQEEDIQFIDFRFTDLLGKLHHTTYRASAIGKAELEYGVTIDGSSIVGWKEIEQSDMIIKPELNTLYMDPFSAQSTLILFCQVIDPLTQSGYLRDPRTIAKNAQTYLKDSGVGDNAYFGPELEFFIFDSVRYKNQPHDSGFKLDFEEGLYNSYKKYEAGNHGHRPGVKGGYFPVPPVDSLNDIRAEMSLALESVGLKVGVHHHEVAESQCEIGFEYDELLTSSDNVQKFKYIVKNVAASYGKTVTFMPKPLFGDNGSGMHTHQSIWKNGENLFFSKAGQYSNLSDICLYYIGGIIKHAKAISAFTNPTTNSYKRLVPGYEAPTQLAYSECNRSAAIRIPYVHSDKAKRIEVRFPDPTANPYLAFAALMMAGIDGIKNKIHPGVANDKNLYNLNEAEKEKVPTMCTSLKEAIQNLNNDREFLKQGNVFSDDIIDAYIKLKSLEIETLERRPHPVEFEMYYNF
jgi:glutamine synthetase